jgi:hypothetical protein
MIIARKGYCVEREKRGAVEGESGLYALKREREVQEKREIYRGSTGVYDYD